MFMDKPPKRLFEFGPFCLDTVERLLLRDGEPVSLTQKAFETLCVLVENSGHVLEKDDLIKRIWPDSFVEEATLAQNIFTLRRILGETADKNHYIETVPRRGYRFVARVSEWFSPASESAAARQTAAEHQVRSIAVLPFLSLEPAGDDGHFGMGMADALITKLSNIRKIIVRPTSAVLKYRGQDQEPISAGRELRVKYVLDGKIQRSGDRIRVTTQLLDLDTGSPMWADKFDANFIDIFTLQDTISERLVEALMLQISSDERKLLTKHHTTNSEAYQLYLKGRYQWNRWTENGFGKSIQCFQQVIEIDPYYALAYAGLSDVYNALAFYGYVSPGEAMPQAKEAAELALELDEMLAEAHLSLASAQFYYEWDWKAAEQSYRRAIGLNPGYATAHQGYGLFLVAMGRFEEATLSLRQAHELDPVSLLINTTMGFPYYFSGEYDKALEQYLKSLDMNSEFGLTYASIGDVYVHKGMYAEALSQYRKAISLLGENPDLLSSLAYAYAQSGDKAVAIKASNELMKLSQQRYISPLALAVIELGLGNKESALKWLEEAYEKRSNRIAFLKVNPVFDSLRYDHRFISLLARIGL